MMRPPFYIRALLPCLFLPGALLLAPRAQALPTANPLPGVTGLGVVPTTDSVPSGVPEVSLSYERIKLDNGGGDVDLLPVAGVIYGLGRGEVGATYVRERSDLGGSIGGANFRQSYYALQSKLRVYERRNTALAVGAHYYDFGNTSGVDLGNVLSGYVTASYALRQGGGPGARGGARLHGGLLVQRVRGEGESDTLLRPFVGAEYVLARDVSLAADYLASDEDAARAFTVGLRYTPQSSPLSAQIGVGQLRGDTRYLVGVSYRFGGARTSQQLQTPSQEVQR